MSHQLVDPPSQLGERHLLHAPLEHQVLAAGRVDVDPRVLRDVADRAAHGVRVARDVVAGDHRPSLVGHRQGDEDPDGRRLARAVRAEQAEHLTLRDGEAEPVERLDALRIGLREPVDLDRSHGIRVYRGGYARPVRIRLRLFAGLREQAGTASQEVDLPDGSLVCDVWERLEPALGTAPPGVLYALNREYVDEDHPLADGDELALIPPVSGGDVRLTDGPIDLGAVVAEVAREEAGAIATFVGTTRVNSRGRTVARLEYEAFEGMAEQEMARIADDLMSRYDLCEVAMAHRVGPVQIGEASIAIAVSAPHRADALAACKDAIDTLKETVPLWKKEIYEDGEEWIGRGS